MVAKIRILSDIFTIFASWTKLKRTAIRRAIKIFWRSIVAIATFLFALALIIQLPQVQTYVTKKVTGILSESLDGDITFEKMHFKPFTTLVIKNVSIVDRNPFQDPLFPDSEKIDTFFRADYIIARFTLDGLIRNEGIHIDKAFISNAQMNLVLENKEDTGDGDISTDNLSRIFRIKDPEKSEPNEKEIFKIKKVEISNMGFAMKSYMADRLLYEGGIDWNDLDIKNIDLNARNLRFKGGIMYGNCDHLSFKEKSGYEVEKMTGSAEVGRGKTIVEDLHIDDLWSDVHLSLFMMSYADIKAFDDFISQVRIDGDIETSILDFETLSYFAPELKGNHLKAVVSGRMSGPVDDFAFSDISIKSLAGGFKGKADGRMTGLPDIENTRLEARLSDFSVTAEGLGKFISEWTMGKGNIDLSDYAKGISFRLNATGRGFLNHLKVNAGIRSTAGNLTADVTLDDIVSIDKAIGITGNLITKDLDISKIAGIELLGPLSLNTGFDASIGDESIPSSIRIDSLAISRLHANGYDYSNIAAVGNLTNESFDGKIISSDPNLNFMFQGTFALSDKTHNAKYKFYANIGHADLHALNIDKRGISRINLRASADFTRSGHGDLRGKIDIGGLCLENRLGRENIGDISMTSYSADSTYIVRMDSKFANGKYTGTAPLKTFISDLRDITLKEEIPALFKDSTYVWNGNSYDINFKCSNSMNLLSFIMPGLYVDEGTTLTASLDHYGTFRSQLKSNRLAFGRNYLKGVDMQLDNIGNRLSGSIDCSEIKAASITMCNNHLVLHADDDDIGMKFSYDNHSDLENRGELLLKGHFNRNPEHGLGLDLNVLPSALYLHSKEWGILPSTIMMTEKGIDIDSFALVSGDEQVRLDGRMSKTQTDTLALNLDRFDISIINQLVDGLGIRGAATGHIQLTSPLTDKSILIDILCDSTSIADVPLGELNIGSRWDEVKKNFALHANTMLDGKNTLDINGTLVPDSRILDITAELDGMKIDYAQPFLSDVFSEMNGKISGTINLKGPMTELSISSSDTRLENAMLRIDYTNVPYYADGPFHIDDSGVYFDNISLKDRYKGTGNINGSINWDHLRDMSFNTQIKVSGIEGINLAEGQGEGFYGRIFGTGNVSITGPMNSLLLTVDAVTEKAGHLHIPLSGMESAGKTTNLLRFKEKVKEEKIDPYEKMIARIEKKNTSESNFTVKLRINAQPEVEAYVEIDKATGNVLSGRGNGLIDLEVGNDIFSINGDYTLTGGNYKFVAMGLVGRDFQIQNGSSIRFNGDIMESTLNIDAVYRTKASLSTLLADVSSVSSKRNVDCMISITDQLSNPRLGFGIEIPDLNPMIKSRVESALSTEDKVQKQFLSLIVSNNFLPDEQSGIVNNSSALYSNVTEIFANQLNNIFQKLDIPVDLGLNYQPNEQGNDLFDVAVSTQLFNNRVVVNGNIGNKQYPTEDTQNDVVGDLDIEIKLDRSGSVRLNLFSHSADQFSNYLDNSQRNGIGIMYQTEFNTFKGFIRNLFMRKAKRQEARLKEEQAMLESGKVELIIDKSTKKRKQDLQQ